MAERKSPGDDATLAHAYRDIARETPSAALDARILNAARAAVVPPARRRLAARWGVPLSLAAMVVLSVGVVLRLTQEGALQPTPAPMARDTGAPLEYSAPPTAAPPAAQAPKLARERAEAPAPEARADRAARSAAPDAAPQSLRKQAPATVAAQSLSAAPPGADVIGVAARGRPGAYQFDVTVKSPDTGCDRYADWWEVVGIDGELLYRRVLAHSHVDEQPFTRAGGPVPIGAETEVWVRAHMNTGGYGGMAMRGSPARGFTPAPLPASFAAAVANAAPRPDSCAF